MDDLISRQAAIDHLQHRLMETAINNVGVVDDVDYVYEDLSDNRIEAWIDELPSVQPEQKTGRWIDRYHNGNWYCSNCGAVVEKDEQDNHNWYFCYHCGAKMESEESE